MNRYERLRFKTWPDGVQMVIWEILCAVCMRYSEFTDTAESYDRWRAGALIQDVWPDLSVDEREVRISGLHPVCFNKVGGSE